MKGLGFILRKRAHFILSRSPYILAPGRRQRNQRYENMTLCDRIVAGRTQLCARLCLLLLTCTSARRKRRIRNEREQKIGG